MSPLRPDLSAKQAFQRIWQWRRFSDADLGVIVDAVRTQTDPAAAWCLRKLTSRHREACDAVEELANDPAEMVRLSVVRCVSQATPRDTVLSLLRRLLTDPSSRVRSAAVWATAELHCRELAEDIARQAEVESSEESSDELRQVVQLLKAGYVMKPNPRGYTDLYVLCRSGVISTAVSDDTLRRVGIDELVRQWRQW